MSIEIVVGHMYVWRRDDKEDVVEAASQPTMQADVVWQGSEFPGPVLQCSVGILSTGQECPARVDDLFPSDEASI
ncbi:MAG: hypothetical protein GY778_07730 [bacterium]|nr:hypothetical protein [bacterium]